MPDRDNIRKGFGDFWRLKRGLTRHATLFFPVSRPSRAPTHEDKAKSKPKCTQSEIPCFVRETWGTGRLRAQEIGARKAPFSKSARRGAPPIGFSRRSRTKARYAFWVDVAQTADVGRPPR